MAVAVANADIPPLGMPTMPSSAYNIPLNLSSILWMIPGSRFLGQLRRGGSGFEPLDVSEPSTTAIETLAIQASVLAAEVTEQQLYDNPQSQQQQLPPRFPGPWEFFTSGYIVGLFIMVCFFVYLLACIAYTETGCRLYYCTECKILFFLLRVEPDALIVLCSTKRQYGNVYTP